MRLLTKGRVDLTPEQRRELREKMRGQSAAVAEEGADPRHQYATFREQSGLHGVHMVRPSGSVDPRAAAVYDDADEAEEDAEGRNAKGAYKSKAKPCPCCDGPCDCPPDCKGCDCHRRPGAVLHKSMAAKKRPSPVTSDRSYMNRALLKATDLPDMEALLGALGQPMDEGDIAAIVQRAGGHPVLQHRLQHLRHHARQKRKGAGGGR